MRSLKPACFLIPFVASLAGCQGSEAKSTFVAQCNTSFGGNKDVLCGCVFDELNDKFSDDQMTRISGIFKTNIPKAISQLKASSDQSDLEIAQRINEVEQATEGCFKKLK